MSRVNASSRASGQRPISSRQNPVVGEYRRLRSRRAGDPHVLLDGLHLVEEARRTGVPVVSAAFSVAAVRQDPQAAALADALGSNGTSVAVVTDPVMRALSPVDEPSGVVAIGRCTLPTLDRLFARSPALILIAVDVQDPGNLGAITRAGEAGGATGVIATGASADPYSWKALRGSMGSTFRLPVIGGMDTAAAIDAARQRGLQVFATAAREGISVYDVDLARPTALVLGSEGPGLARGVVGMTDGSVSVPMTPPVDSLNVAVAAAILVYEARRQRAART